MKNCYLIACGIASLLTGCANSNGIYRTFDVSKSQSPMVDIRQRAILVNPISEEITEETQKVERGTVVKKVISKNDIRVCAETSPDAMASFAYQLAASGGTPDKLSAQLSASLQDSAAFVGLRTQSIQLLRDFGYRLCEAYLSGGLTKLQYDLMLRRYQKNTVALLAIEQLTGTVRTPAIALTSDGQSEAAKSLNELLASKQKVEEDINAVKKQKDDALKADSTVDVSSYDSKITTLTEQRKGLDKAIESAKSVATSGKTTVVITSDPNTAKRSDEHIAQVANVVKDIVNNIVLSDDQAQICLSVLQTPRNKDDLNSVAISDYCKTFLLNQVNAEQLKLKGLDDKLNDLVVKLKDPKITDVDKKKLRDDLEQVVKDAGSIGNKIYSKKTLE